LRRAAIGAALILLLAFLIAFTLRAVSAHRLAKETARAYGALPTVEVIRLQAEPTQGALTLPGETAAWYESTIFARVSGFVAHWHADIGDHVKAGEVLAQIDTPELDAELQAAKAKLEVAAAQLQVKQADAAFAATTYARWRDSPKGVVSDQEREDKKAGDTSAAAQLAAAHAQVTLAQADVDRLSAFEQFKKVTAPYAGTIIERRIDIGNLVTAGSSAGNTPLYRMSQDDPIRVFVDVPQSAAPALMKDGVIGRLILNDSAATTIAGRITRTSEAINPEARTFRVEMDLPNPNRHLLPGLYVQVAFDLPSNGLLSVPAAALVFSGAGPSVARIDSSGTVHFTKVSIARDDGDQVQLGSGVSAGDELALNISNQITDGQKVHAVMASTAAPMASAQAVR
jgi:RND family efflux transporter MFP subunit